jgi:hypothetical protein
LHEFGSEIGLLRGGPLLAVSGSRRVFMTNDRVNSKQEGRVLVPALLWMAGVPFGIVLLLWFFFFRG